MGRLIENDMKRALEIAHEGFINDIRKENKNKQEEHHAKVVNGDCVNGGDD